MYLFVILEHLLEVTAEDIYGPGGERLEEVTGVGVIHCERGRESISGGWVVGWEVTVRWMMWEQRWWR